jgi:hypothetical membrane protein
VGTTNRVLPLKQHVAASRAAARLLAGPVPAWTVAAAALSEVLLVGGWLVAGALQPVSYSPMQQTMSDLAGQTATDPWVMTAALFGVGGSQLAAGLGLTRASARARMVLILAGLSTIGVAASPDAASGPTPWHLAFAVSSIVTTLVWPLFAVRREPDRPWVLGVCCGLTVTVLFAALSGWLLISTQGSGDLGLVERLTCSAQGLWPLVVALALWQAEARSPIRPGRGPLCEADTDLAAHRSASLVSSLTRDAAADRGLGHPSYGFGFGFAEATGECWTVCAENAAAAPATASATAAMQMIRSGISLAAGSEFVIEVLPLFVDFFGTTQISPLHIAV